MIYGIANPDKSLNLNHYQNVTQVEPITSEMASDAGINQEEWI